MRVSYPPGTASAIARPRLVPATPPALPAPSADAPAAARASDQARVEELVDHLIRGIWSLAVAVGVVPGWEVEDWRRADFAPEQLLDLLVRGQEEAVFPYPGSPRYDGTGGGRRIADDGSPEWSPAFLRYLSRAEVGSRAHGRGGPLGLAGAEALVHAQAWLAHEEPALWRLYSAHVIGQQSLAQLIHQAEAAAAQGQRPPTRTQLRHQLALARTLLLAHIALWQAEVDGDEVAEVSARAAAAASAASAGAFPRTAQRPHLEEDVNPSDAGAAAADASPPAPPTLLRRVKPRVAG